MFDYINKEKIKSILLTICYILNILLLFIFFLLFYFSVYDDFESEILKYTLFLLSLLTIIIHIFILFHAKKIKIVCLIWFIAVIIYFILIKTIFFFGSSDFCDSYLIEENFSPNQNNKAVVFQYDCGATTDYSTQVSILNAKEILKDNRTSIFVADTDHGKTPRTKYGGPEVRIKWIDDKNIEISYYEKDRIFKNDENFNDISIKYSTFK